MDASFPVAVELKADQSDQEGSSTTKTAFLRLQCRPGTQTPIRGPIIRTTRNKSRTFQLKWTLYRSHWEEQGAEPR
jgi:hypothetical protein